MAYKGFQARGPIGAIYAGMEKAAQDFFGGGRVGQSSLINRLQ